MAAKESQQMKKARRLVLSGMSAYAAAKEAGVTKQAIYMAPWYKQHKESQPCDTKTITPSGS